MEGVESGRERHRERRSKEKRQGKARQSSCLVDNATVVRLWEPAVWRHVLFSRGRWRTCRGSHRQFTWQKETTVAWTGCVTNRILGDACAYAWNPNRIHTVGCPVFLFIWLETAYILILPLFRGTPYEILGPCTVHSTATLADGITRFGFGRLNSVCAVALISGADKLPLALSATNFFRTEKEQFRVSYRYVGLYEADA